MLKQKKSELNMLRMMNGKETLPESDQDARESDEESIEAADFQGSDFTYRCHECGTGFCYSQFDNEEHARFCTNCTKDCCVSCTPKEEWYTCSRHHSQYICKECGDDTCSSCDKKACYLCSDTCPSCKLKRCSDCVKFLVCKLCYKEHCAECFDGKENDVTHCDACERDYCQGCRTQICQKEDACSKCNQMLSAKLQG